MYDDIIDRIVESLPSNTALNRRPHYARLREELGREMRRTQPPLTEREMRARMMGLEEAILRRENKERDAIPARVRSGEL